MSEKLSTLDIERNRLARQVNYRIRELIKHPELGPEGTITAIDKQLANAYNRVRSPVEGMTWQRAKEHGGGATEAEVKALRRIVSWKSSTPSGLRQIHRAANDQFRRWGYRGPALTPQQISAFFENEYYKHLENLWGSDIAVRIMTEVLNDPAKIEAVYRYLVNTYDADPKKPELKEALTSGEFIRDKESRWGRGQQLATDSYVDKSGRTRAKQSGLYKAARKAVYGRMKRGK